MAKNINHLQHVKSSVVENGLPKLPAPNVLVEGELAVNYATDKETISLKNSSGIVVTFSSDNYYSEKKLGSGFTGENSAVTVTQAINDNERVVAAALTDLDERKLDASAYTQQDLSEYATKQWVDEERLGSGFTGENSGATVTQAMNNTEKVVAAALNDLDGRKLDTSAYTPTDLSDYATKQWVNEERLGSGFTGENSGKTVTQVIEDDELAISAALNDLNDRKLDMSAYTPTDLSNYYDKDEIDGFLDGFDSELLKYADKAEYNSSDKKIYFKNGNITLSSMTIDATAFIKDGMVNEVKIGEPTSGESSGVTCLIVTFNTDAGKEDIEIPLSRIFDSSLYYTKPEIDNVLGSGFTVSAVTSSVTDVFRENELIVASALNDLNSRKLDASAYTPTDLSGYYTQQEINTMLGGDFIDFSGESFSSVTDIIRADETVMAAALNDLNDRKLDASAYTPSEFTDLLDEKLGYWFSGDSLSSVTDVIRENEIIVSSALNDLESRKLDTSAYTPTDLSGYYTKQEIDEDKLGSGFTGDNSGTTVTDAFNTVERVVAAALTDLDDRKLDASAFTESVSDFYTKEKVDDKLGEWFSGDTPISSVTEVIREDELAISAALNDLDGRKLDASAYTPTDLSGYYTKQEIDEDKLGSGFTGENSGKTVTQAINETEIVVAAALTDLDDRKLDASAYTQPDLSAYATKEWIEDDVLGSGFTTGDYSGKSITEVIEENELIIASALNDLDERIIEVSGNTGVGTIVSGEYSNGTLYLDKNDGTSIEVSGFTTGGGGGEENVITGITVNSVSQTPSNKVVNITVPTSLSQITSAHSHSEYALNTAFTAHTGDSTAHVTSTEKSTWNNKQNALSNANVLTGITSQKVTNWDNASASAHSHSNKSVLDGITAAKVSDWDTVTAKTDNSAFTAHTASTDVHVTASEKSTWNGKQDAISDLASIRTSAATQSDWNATSGVAMIKNKPTIPTNLNQLTSAHTHAISEVTNLQSTLNAKVSGITINNTGKVTPTNGVANLTINASTVGALPTGTTLDNIADGATRKLSNYSLTSHTHDEYATTGTVNTLNNTVTAHTANTEIHVTAANKTSWDNAVTSAHSHSNKTVLDNLTQDVINNSHTHSNKTALDGITTAKTASWDTVTAKTDNSSFTAHTADTTVHVTTANKTQWNNAISGVSFNGATATVSNHVAAITATIPAAPGTLTTTATTAQATATNQSLSGNIALHKVSKTGSYNDLNDKPTIPAAANNATITLQFGNSSSAFTVNASSNLTINLATLIGIPAPTASDNGKILMVVNGAWALVNPTTIYTGSGTPSNSQGNNGDIYLQTS